MPGKQNGGVGRALQGRICVSVFNECLPELLGASASGAFFGGDGMSGAHTTRADDERVLEILDAKFRKGVSHPDILRKFGLSNSALQGLVFRTVRDKTPCACTKAENKDGGMPARWWAQ